MPVLQAEASACNTGTTETQPHKISTTQRTENKTTDVVIQQQSRKLLMMDILISETYWVHKKWNKIASDIKLVFYSSAMKVNIASCWLLLYGLPFSSFPWNERWNERQGARLLVTTSYQCYHHWILHVQGNSAILCVHLCERENAHWINMPRKVVELVLQNSLSLRTTLSRLREFKEVHRDCTVQYWEQGPVGIVEKQVLEIKIDRPQTVAFTPTHVCSYAHEEWLT